MSERIRCGTKGCPNEPSERVPDSKLPHVIYDLCASCAAGMRLLQSMPAGALIDAKNVPPLTFEPVAATGRPVPIESLLDEDDYAVMREEDERDSASRYGSPPCADECRAVLREMHAKACERAGVPVPDSHITHVAPLIPTAYLDVRMRCPHGVVWHMQPTSEQIAEWAAEGVA